MSTAYDAITIEEDAFVHAVGRLTAQHDHSPTLKQVGFCIGLHSGAVLQVLRHRLVEAGLLQATRCTRHDLRLTPAGQLLADGESPWTAHEIEVAS